MLISGIGDFFIHFLDSPEQGLLVIPLYTDIHPNGGGTWICSEGPKRIGKWLVSDRPFYIVMAVVLAFADVCFIAGWPVLQIVIAASQSS